MELNSEWVTTVNKDETAGAVIDNTSSLNSNKMNESGGLSQHLSVQMLQMCRLKGFREKMCESTQDSCCQRWTVQRFCCEYRGPDRKHYYRGMKALWGVSPAWLELTHSLERACSQKHIDSLTHTHHMTLTAHLIGCNHRPPSSTCINSSLPKIQIFPAIGNTFYMPTLPQCKT